MTSRPSRERQPPAAEVDAPTGHRGHGQVDGLVGDGYRNFPRPATIALWNLRTGAVTVLGQTVASAYFGPIEVVTPPGAGYSLIAWMPSHCKLLINCPIQVTNTATGSSITLHSPMPNGFALGGAFSPDGRELAVIVNTSRGPCCAAAELAIASSQTGSLRLVPRARFTIGQDGA